VAWRQSSYAFTSPSGTSSHAYPRDFAGAPVNVTFLFSRARYFATAEAYLRGVERSTSAGLTPDVALAASLFVSRWDVAIADKAPAELRNQLGIAIASQVYESCREELDSPRWQRNFNAGARAQRLLFTSSGTKDPKASDTLYVQALAAPFTLHTLPEATLKALADHGEIDKILPPHVEEKLTRFANAGVDTDALGTQLQERGAASFVKSWKDLIERIALKSTPLRTT
jgi:transaldolase